MGTSGLSFFRPHGLDLASGQRPHQTITGLRHMGKPSTERHSSLSRKPRTSRVDGATSPPPNSEFVLSLPVTGKRVSSGTPFAYHQVPSVKVYGCLALRILNRIVRPSLLSNIRPFRHSGRKAPYLLAVTPHVPLLPNPSSHSPAYLLSLWTRLLWASPRNAVV